MPMLNAEEEGVKMGEDLESKKVVNSRESSNDVLPDEESKDTRVRLCRSH